jgi:hypothetical protein
MRQMMAGAGFLEAKTAVATLTESLKRAAVRDRGLTTPPSRYTFRSYSLTWQFAAVS